MKSAPELKTFIDRRSWRRGKIGQKGQTVFDNIHHQINITDKDIEEFDRSVQRWGESHFRRSSSNSKTDYLAIELSIILNDGYTFSKTLSLKLA